MDHAGKLLSRPVTDQGGQTLPYSVLGLPTCCVGGCLSKPRLSTWVLDLPGRGWSFSTFAAIIIHNQELWNPPLQFLKGTYLCTCLIISKVPVTVVYQTHFCSQKMILHVCVPVGKVEMWLYSKGDPYLMNKLTYKLYQAHDNTAVKNKILWKSSSPVEDQNKEHHRDVPWLLLEKFPVDIFCGFCRIFFEITKYSEIHSWGHVNAVA